MFPAPSREACETGAQCERLERHHREAGNSEERRWPETAEAG